MVAGTGPSRGAEGLHTPSRRRAAADHAARATHRRAAVPARLGLDAERDWAQLVGKSSCELVCAEASHSVAILDRPELLLPSESKGLSRSFSYPSPTLGE